MCVYICISHKYTQLIYFIYYISLSPHSWSRCMLLIQEKQPTHFPFPSPSLSTLPLIEHKGDMITMVPVSDRSWNGSSSLACSWLTGSLCGAVLSEGLRGWIPMSVCEVNWGKMKFPLSSCLPLSDVDVQPLLIPFLCAEPSGAHECHLCTKAAAMVCVNLGLVSQVALAHWLISD